jgi:uncharacterized protein (DUF1800 family)
MADRDIDLVAHLMRRAGFGATRDELDGLAEKGYDAVVDDLLDPGPADTMPDDIIRRYHVDQSELRIQGAATANWLYKMISTKAPLEEKTALFWHSLFATGERKVNNMKTMMSQIDMFRRHGQGSFRTLLVELSKNPAMLYWLDNNENHKGAPNENYGRELLELFAMGIGNYTEQDVKECARAFTGWTVEAAEYMTLRSTKASIWPYGRVAFQFEYRPDDHDDSEKQFLGETGNFNGEDIVDIVVRHPATARFVAWRLFLFFVADEVDEQGEKLIDDLAQSYFDSGYSIKSMLRTLFLSDYFKSDAARFARVKSPVELVAGILRVTQEFQKPKREIWDASVAIDYMGQELLNPPSVEGWHEGSEWIDSGAMVERVNFGAARLGNAEHPGVRAIIDRLRTANGGVLDPDRTVEECLDILGPVPASTDTRESLVAHVAKKGPVDLSDGTAQRRVAEVFSLIASTREFQLA